MGLFGGGKTCAVCGSKAGLLSRQKLSDDSYVCSDCQLKVSDQLRSDDYRRMSLGNFRKCMEEFSSETARIQNEFQETFSIYAGSGNNHKILAADQNHGWWYCAEYYRPMLLTFDQIQSWSVRMDTVPDSDDDKEKGLGDLFTSFAESSYYASLRQNHPELPTCPPGNHVTSMEVVVSLSNPYLRQAVLDVWKPGWFTDKTEDMSNAYNAAIQVVEFFQRMRGQAPMGGAYGQNMYGGNAYVGNGYAGNAYAGNNYGGNTYQRAGQAPMPAAASAAPSASDPTAELRKYKGLLDEGIISQEEYDAKKRQLLGL